MGISYCAAETQYFSSLKSQHTYSAARTNTCMIYLGQEKILYRIKIVYTALSFFFLNEVIIVAAAASSVIDPVLTIRS